MEKVSNKSTSNSCRKPFTTKRGFSLSNCLYYVIDSNLTISTLEILKLVKIFSVQWDLLIICLVNGLLPPLEKPLDGAPCSNLRVVKDQFWLQAFHHKVGVEPVQFSRMVVLNFVNLIRLEYFRSYIYALLLN